jgi:tripartite-type tricarboxylate transporter receptor subunit TctC
VLGLPAGGGADTVARVLGNRLSELWHQPVIVENKSGAGGHPAYESVAHASPDGYTILMSTRSPGLGSLLSAAANYKTADFQPISSIGKFPMLFAVPNSSPAKSLQDFVAHAKANPGKLTYATTGVGTIGHLAGELFKRTAGIEITHVPYRGASMGAMSDLMAGRVHSMFNGVGSLIGAVREKQIRGLAVTTAARFPTVPELPGFAEAGVVGYDVALWYAFYLPAGTPADVIRKLHDDTAAVLQEPAAKAKIEPVGIAVAASTPEELAAIEHADIERWAPIIQALNLRG